MDHSLVYLHIKGKLLVQHVKLLVMGLISHQVETCADILLRRGCDKVDFKMLQLAAAPNCM